MSFELEKFKAELDALESNYGEWFIKHPALDQDASQVNSIHDHYYIYMNSSGHQLRFNASSNLPPDIRQEIKEIFARFAEAEKDSGAV